MKFIFATVLLGLVSHGYALQYDNALQPRRTTKQALSRSSSGSSSSSGSLAFTAARGRSPERERPKSVMRSQSLSSLDSGHAHSRSQSPSHSPGLRKSASMPLHVAAMRSQKSTQSSHLTQENLAQHLASIRTNDQGAGHSVWTQPPRSSDSGSEGYSSAQGEMAGLSRRSQHLRKRAARFDNQ